MTQRFLDTDLISRRRAELGLSTRESAAAVGVTAPGYAAIENGSAQADLPWAIVVHLSEAFGLRLDQLVKSAGEAPDSEPDDAARIGRMLHGATTPVLIGALCDATGWTLERVQAALRELEHRLTGVGLGLRRVAIGIAVATDGVEDPAVAEVLRTHLARRHASVVEAGLLLAIQHGDAPTQPANHERVAIGVLVNAGLVEAEQAAGRTRERALVLSEDVRFSLLLDEEPEEVGTGPVRRPRRSSATLSKRS
jgi:transcriptional regulator with XRE-family HTH domain